MSKTTAPNPWKSALYVVPVIAVTLVVIANFRPSPLTASSSHRFPLTTAPSSVVPPIPAKPGDRKRIQAAFAALPLAFEENRGQADPQVKYMARGNGYQVFLTGTEATLAFASRSAAGNFSERLGRTALIHPAAEMKTSVVHMKLRGANAHPLIVASSELPGHTNYYIGNDPKNWHPGVSQFARVSYKNVYPGVNVDYYGQNRSLEFDFVVAPNANPSAIDLKFQGVRKIKSNSDGSLEVSSSSGDAVLHKPFAYQEKNGIREAVNSRFELSANNDVHIRLGSYDRSRELVIDPAVTYATYFGGSGDDDAFAIAVDSSGNAYITGQTKSINFPGGLAAGPNLDIFVSKLSASGSALLYSTLIGGNADSTGVGIAVNSTATYVAGGTGATNLATTFALGPLGGQDVFVAELNNTTGTTIQLAQIGGSGSDSAAGLALDSTGNVYVGGQTSSTDFPTASPLQAANGGAFDGFVLKLNSSLSAADYSTYLGGTGGDLVTGIATDASGNAYVSGITLSSDFPVTAGSFQTSLSGTGDNAFVAALKSDGSSMIYSTFLGASGTTDALAIAVDSAGEAYVTGDTNASAFPTVNPVQSTLKGATDVFITKLNAAGSGLVFSTFFGGTLDEEGSSIALDSFNDVYVTGRTFSSDYPTSGTPFQASLSGGTDAFITELSSTGFTVYSSYLGGTGDENSIGGDVAGGPSGAVAVDASSNAYVAGSTNSTTGFPVSASPLQGSSGGGLSDAFVAEVAAAPADFSIALSPATLSTSAGQSTSTITVTISSVNAPFGSAVTLSCSGKPTNSACNFSALSGTPSSNAVTSNLTISTNGSTGNAMSLPPAGRSTWFYAMLLPLAGFSLIGLRKQLLNKSPLAMLSLIAAIMLLTILPACGGGGSKNGGGGGGGTNTPAGTYTITVTGTSGSTNHSAPLTLTVN